MSFLSLTHVPLQQRSPKSQAGVQSAPPELVELDEAPLPLEAEALAELDIDEDLLAELDAEELLAELEEVDELVCDDWELSVVDDPALPVDDARVLEVASVDDVVEIEVAEVPPVAPPVLDWLDPFAALEPRLVLAAMLASMPGVVRLLSTVPLQPRSVVARSPEASWILMKEAYAKGRGTAAAIP
jgi:hypothetical protein